MVSITEQGDLQITFPNNGQECNAVALLSAIQSAVTCVLKTTASNAAYIKEAEIIDPWHLHTLTVLLDELNLDFDQLNDVKDLQPEQKPVTTN